MATANVDRDQDRFGIDLYWLPLGAGGNFVRLNGRIYEAIEATIQRRPRYDLYHSGLEVIVPDGRYTIEQTPALPHGEERGRCGHRSYRGAAGRRPHPHVPLR